MNLIDINLENILKNLKANSIINNNTIKSGILSFDNLNITLRKNLTTIYSLPSFGKTLYSLILAKYNIKNNSIVYIDTDCSIDINYVYSLGISNPNLLVSQVSSFTDLLDLVKKLIKSNDIDVIIIDTITSLTNENGYYISNYDILALKNLLKFSKTALIFTSQYRTKIFKSSKTIIDTLIQNSDYNIVLKNLNYVTTDTYKYIIECKLYSNKYTKSSKICIDTSYNIVNEYELIYQCLNTGILTRNGVWVKYGTTVLGNGIFNSIDYLVKNKYLYEILFSQYLEKMNNLSSKNKSELI